MGKYVITPFHPEKTYLDFLTRPSSNIHFLGVLKNMINIKMQTNEAQKLSPKIAVIGIGGAGGNAVNNMIASNLEGCEFIVCNTDAQALNASLAEDRVQLGVNVTGGLGAGSKPEIGQAAAEESLDELMQYLDGANMAFVTCGMGGGTGTGAAPVIAKACRQQGILTVGVVTKPFHFEGVHRMEQAEKGIEEMQQYVDTLIVIPNQNLFRVANEKTTFAEGFKMADTVLQSGVRGVTDLMVRPGIVNLDFADIRTAMLQMGKAMMGTGEAEGDKRAVEAAEAAINNPLLDDVSMKGANGVIINVTGGYDMTLFEVDEACNRIRDEVDPSANIIFGTTFDDSMEGIMRVSIIATGIEGSDNKGKVLGGGDAPGNRSSKRGGGISIASASSSPSTAVASLSGDNDDKGKEKSPVALSGREVVQGISAPSLGSPLLRASPSSRKAQPQSAQDNSKEEKTSADMFEQAELLEDSGDTVLRGSTYKDSFIPPKPMEPDMAIAENGIGSHISSFHGAHVKPKTISPAPSSHSLKAERSPSLLERITGSVQQRIDHLLDDSDSASQTSKESDEISAKPAGFSRSSPPPSSPSQGSLNINAPARKPAVKLDDELDIPAFLRRQAN